MWSLHWTWLTFKLLHQFVIATGMGDEDASDVRAASLLLDLFLLLAIAP
jgi:hypothetical protein